MFTRLVTFTGATDIDAGIDYVRDTVVPVLHSQRGFRGVTASADRAGRVFSVLTLWETEADRDASESALLKVREEGQDIIGGSLSVEYFEQVLMDVVAGLPKVGSALLVTRVTMDPATIDENADYFQREVLPLIKAGPGLIAVRQLVNRQTGDAMVGAVYTDRASMESAAKGAEERQRTADVPVTIKDRSLREILFVDLVP